MRCAWGYLRCAGFLLLALARVVSAFTYEVQVGTMVLTGQTTGPALRWAQLPVRLTSFFDMGGPYDQAVAEAAEDWNAVRLTFTVATDAPVVVRWASPGELPPTMAAWTQKQIQGGQIVRAEVLVDPQHCWAVYDGPLVSTLCHGAWTMVQDLRRVVLHELGHVVGLSHPDAGGQQVVAIMNSVESDLDHLTADDRAGRLALAQESPGALLTGQEGGGGGCALTQDQHGVWDVSALALGVWWVFVRGRRRYCLSQRGGGVTRSGAGTASQTP